RPDAVPVILTAYPELSLVIRALNDACTYKFLTKPCDPDTIQMTVRRALDVLDLQRENARLAAGLARRNAELQEALETLRAAHEELVYSEKMAMVGRLCAGFAHELSTPVSVLEFEHRGLQTSFTALTRLMDEVAGALEADPGSAGQQRLEQVLDE